MRRISTIEILGGGPAGLYTAILVRRLMPHVKVRVTEQNPHGATFGFGVVFSDRALEFLAADDPETHDLVAPAMERWRDMILPPSAGRRDARRSRVFRHWKAQADRDFWARGRRLSG